MAPSIDFSSVQSLDPVPNGTYNAEIVHAEEGVSKAGHPKMDLRWKITEGEHAGRQIFDSMSFHPSALWRTKATLQALGFPETFNGELGAEDLVGREAQLVVTLESGRTDPATGEPYPDRNRITRVRPVGSSVSNLLS